MLVSQTPGGLYEQFLEEAGEHATGESTPRVSEAPTDIRKIAVIAAEYGIEMPLGPVDEREADKERGR